jgi:hypothetical protein
MIYTLMKEYGLDRQRAELMTEYDYNILIAFKNLEITRQNKAQEEAFKK